MTMKLRQYRQRDDWMAPFYTMPHPCPFAAFGCSVSAESLEDIQSHATTCILVYWRAVVVALGGDPVINQGGVSTPLLSHGPCPLYPIGCEFVASRFDVEVHLQHCVPYHWRKLVEALPGAEALPAYPRPPPPAPVPAGPRLPSLGMGYRPLDPEYQSPYGAGSYIDDPQLSVLFSPNDLPPPPSWPLEAYHSPVNSARSYPRARAYEPAVEPARSLDFGVDGYRRQSFRGGRLAAGGSPVLRQEGAQPQPQEEVEVLKEALLLARERAKVLEMEKELLARAPPPESTCCTIA